MQNVRRRTGAEGPDKPADAQRRSRGRPRAFDRDKALDAAMRLFWQKGFAATSISDLTDAMGIGSPSLYAAYGSKEALYAEALRRFTELGVPLVWAPLEEGPTARQAVEAYLLAVAANFPVTSDKPAGCMVTLSAVGQEGCETLGELVASYRREGMRRLEARLSRAVAEGELPPGTDTAALARFFLAVQQGMAIQARDGASRAELESIALAAVERWPGA